MTMILLVPYLIFAIGITVVTFSYAILFFKCKQKAFVSTGLFYQGKEIRKFDQAPGPKPWPIIGNLDLLGRFKNNPFEGFGALTKKYGDIYSITLGHTRCLVVNNVELIKEVLNKNGKHLGGRPDFVRYHKLFGGDRSNSLALCDWSQLQQRRRNLARRHCSPREASTYFSKMSDIGGFEIIHLLDQLNKTSSGNSCDIKPLILQASANMFCQYMCSVRFDYNDKDFQKIVEYFDEIFWEINQGYSFDFLPWLIPFYNNHIKKIVHWSTTIRTFILDRIVKLREINVNLEEPDKDFTDALLKSLKENQDVSRNTIIFMLEDFIGGHSAVGNLVMLALAYIAKNPSIGQQIKQEVDIVSNKGLRSISLYDMNVMPYTMASISEVLRYSSSPIVPHVALEDTVISGFGVTKGTIVFINNFILNMNEKNWSCPDLFEPERFLEIKNIDHKNHPLKLIDFERRSEGSDLCVSFDEQRNSKSGEIKLDKFAKKKCNTLLQLKKTIPHFLPFSVGKRTCIGQNLVRGFGFLLLANIIKNYNVNSADISKIRLEKSSVALPPKCFKLLLRPRT
ncbi:cytochrome P450 307a1 isoform X1 [Drosophila gunungcola]|uniref:cytochrome P450 307a1 isoform X1 n=2 Tax=Drosophila gunungcola TaxID=103775 RepID=UPI0022E5B077|nr:cytochrome P450 307a1 isoform X1 [Drosophila gunungcola]